MHLPRHVHRRLILSDEPTTQGLLETPVFLHCHQLDLILFKRDAHNNVLHTLCSYHSEYGLRRRPLIGVLTFRPQPNTFHPTEKQGNIRIDVSKKSQPTIVTHFAEVFERESSVPHGPNTLPHISGAFSETPCTATP